MRNPVKKSFLFLILLYLVQKSSQQATSSATMKQDTRLPKKLVDPYIRTQYAVRSLLECTAKAQVRDGNFAFMRDNECIMGTITEHIVISSDAPNGNDEVTLWLDKSALDLIIERDFIRVSSQVFTDGFLAGTLYEIVTDIASEELCAAKCHGVDGNVCDLFVQFSTDCYLGTISAPVTANMVPPAGLGSINVEIGRLKELLQNYQATLRPLFPPFSAYNKLLYDSPPTDRNNASLECQALCIIDDITPCHFVVLDDNDQGCHLGSFLVLDQDIQAVSSSIVILMNRVNAIIKTVDSVNHFSFLATTSHRFDVPPANSTEECFVLCMLNNQLCDFSLFWDPLNCYFGSLESIQDTFLVLSQIKGTQPAILSPARMAAKFKILANALYMRMWVTNLAWSVRVKEYFDLVDESFCLVLCHLRYRCDFFVMVHNTCYLGNTDLVRGTGVLKHFPEPANEPRIIYYFFKGRDQSNYRQSPVPDWHRRIYRSVDMSVATAEPNFHPQFYCEALCALDLASCYIYVVDEMGQTCHLGAYHVDTGKPGGFATDAVYTKMSNMMVTHGGRFINDNNNLKRSYEIGSIITEGKKQCGHTGLRIGPPGFSGTEQPKDHSMAYAHPFLVLCALTNAPTIKFECSKMDMTADIRMWQPIPLPPIARTKYVMLAHGDYIYMIGGTNDCGGPCGNIDEIDRFNVITDTWEPAIAKIPQASMEFCAVKAQNKFFLVLGGVRCTSTTMPTLRIYDPQENKWGEGPAIFTTVGRAGMACGVYHTPNDEEWLLVVSGVSANPYGTPSYEVNYIDLAALDQWRNLPNLPGDVEADMRSPESLISLTRRDVVFFTKDNRRMHMDFPDRTFSTSLFDSEVDPRLSAAQVSMPLHLIPICIPRTAVWEMLVCHLSSGGHFIHSINDPRIPLYVIIRMGMLDQSRCADGSYHLRLIWPRLGHMNEWIQTRSPLDDVMSAAERGYKPISVRFPLQFEGLNAGPTTGPFKALMVGKRGSGIYMVGAAQPMAGEDTRFAGPVNTQGVIPVYYIQLFIKTQC